MFERAEKRAPSPRVHAQIGLAHQALGHWLEAELALDKALATPADPWIRQYQEDLLKARAVVAEHLAWLVVHVSVADASIEIPGQPNAAPGVSIRVPSGLLTIAVSAPGYERAIRRIEIPPRATVVESVELAPPPKPRSAPAPVAPIELARSPAPPRSTRAPEGRARPEVLGPVGWIMLGAGIGMVGYGTFLGVRTFQLKHQRDRECSPDGCTSRGVVLDEQARDNAFYSTGSIVIGAALLGSGTWLVIRDLSRTSSSNPPNRTRARGAAVELYGTF